MPTATPVIQQYLEIKASYPDAILFFRIGDFYEMFFEDAKLASEILEIALTSRDKHKEEAVPLCGVPYHAASAYIARLIAQGFKVAICEQMEEAGRAKGIVRREVVRVITPGTVLEEEQLSPKANNYLMGLAPAEAGFGLAFLDASTGDFSAAEAGAFQAVLDEVLRMEPREVLFPASAGGRPFLKGLMKSFPSARYSPLPEEVFRGGGPERLEQLGLSADGKSLAGQAAGAVLFYLEEMQKARPAHLHRLEVYGLSDYLVLDETTRRNLELFENLQTRSRQGSLLGALDQTATPMGARLLKRWLGAPLMDLGRIQERLDAVAEWREKDLPRRRLRELLGRVRDLERLSARVSLRLANPRDLVALKNSLAPLPEIRSLLAELLSGTARRHREGLQELSALRNELERAIEDHPPISPKEGGLIRRGYDSHLDRLRDSSLEGKRWIAELEARERQRTGISSLKVRYNRVFGYYIEVTKPNLPAVPADYLRKQTVANAERFTTPELQDCEMRIRQGEVRREELEERLFRQVLERVAGEVPQIQQDARILAELDVLSSLGELAELRGYCRPELDGGDLLKIVDGRHPVLERFGPEERFVPNDLLLSGEQQILIITGPNMAGKSTLMRQTALIVILAQMGSFVPAREAKIGLVDRIFTRVGASDDLSRGRSTFLVEMEETAHILRNLGPRSLVLLDEIGRGTSTFDGLSIAWAVAEYLHDRCPFRVRTLFATHYHELTELARTKPRLKNFHVAVKEWNDRVIFLRKLVEGATSRSYGIQVARLAGLPSEVIERAKEVLANLEQGEFTDEGLPKLAASRRRRVSWGSGQPTLFSRPPDPLREALRRIDPHRLTPLEALNILSDLKTHLDGEDDPA